MPLAACSAVCIARTSLEITRGGRRSLIAANTEAAIARPTTTPMKNPTLGREHIPAAGGPCRIATKRRRMPRAAPFGALFTPFGATA